MHGVPASSFLYRKVVPELAVAGTSRHRVRPPGSRPGRSPRRLRLHVDRSWAGSPSRQWTRSDSTHSTSSSTTLADLSGSSSPQRCPIALTRSPCSTLLSRSTHSGGPGRWSRSPIASSAMCWSAAMNKPLVSRTDAACRGSRTCPAVSKTSWAARTSTSVSDAGDRRARRSSRSLRGHSSSPRREARALRRPCVGGGRHPVPDRLAGEDESRRAHVSPSAASRRARAAGSLNIIRPPGQTLLPGGSGSGRSPSRLPSSSNG